MKIENVKLPGLAGYVQAAAADRYSTVRFADRDCQRFELRAGDHWNETDAQNDRERTEFRSQNEDAVGEKASYRFGLLIPADYRFMTPKQTLGQWHNGKWDNCFFRLEGRDLAFAINVHEPKTFTTMPVPFTPGRWLDLQVDLDWQLGEKASVKVVADGNVVVDLQKVRLIEDDVKSFYFKHGIYRSDMDQWKGPGAAPTLVVYYSNVERIPGGLAASAPVVTPPPPVPAPAAPTPTPPAPTSASGDLYTRIALLQRELDALGRDVAREYAVSDWAGQASEKLGKLADQMRKLDAKRGKAA